MNKTVFKEDVVRDIFKEFPQLQIMWVKGDLETFYDSNFVIGGNAIHEGELIKFIYTHFEFDENAEIVPLVDNEGFMRTHNLLDTSFIECKREDYV